MSKRLHASATFTFIELLVVMQIIGILAGIVIQQVNATRQRAHIVRMKNDLSAAGRAIEQYRASSPVSDGPIVSHLVSGQASTTWAVTSLSFSAGGTGSSLNGFTTIFGAAESFASGSASYGTRLVNTPSAGFTYYYDARALTSQAIVRSQSVAAQVHPNYAATSGLGSWSLCGSYEQEGVPRYFAFVNGLSREGLGTCPGA